MSKILDVMNQMWIYHLIGIIVLLIASVIVFNIEVSKAQLCNNDKNCDHENMIRTYMQIALYMLKGAFVLLIILQSLYLFNIPVGPVITSLGVFIVMFSFALRDLISDFFSGLMLIFTNQLHLGDEIKLSVSGCSDCVVDKNDTVIVHALMPFSLVVKSQDESIVYIRYRTISAFKMLSDSDSGTLLNAEESEEEGGEEEEGEEE